GDPGDPPAQDAAPQDPSPQPDPEPRPMSRPASRSGNAEVNFKGEKRSNATHASTSDPDARLYRKSPGTGAMLCFLGHALMENRSGFAVQGDLTQADGHAERRAALDMMHRQSPGSTRRLTLGMDKAYDAAGFVADCRQACITPHVAQKARFSAIDGRTTRHRGYALSQKHRKRIEELFGWSKTVGGTAQTVYRGVERVRSRFILTLAAANLARLPRLLAI
ncbi:transposase, partial [Salipiger sp. HF18]|uniref:transposase n=1 Tax=Salipiger sp. HF18 TaxID=2721557 RepID=UPI0020CAB017